MIKLRKMREDEFSAYRRYFIADYGGEISRNYAKPLKCALKLAGHRYEHGERYPFLASWFAARIIYSRATHQPLHPAPQK
jgi:hypothetical protein